MDKKLTKQFGDDLLSYRIQSERTKKRKRKKDFDKRLLKKSREHNALYVQKRNLGWEPVNPPYQHGWKRYFILRADVKAGKKADFFQHILDKVNTTQYSWKKQFTVKRRKFGRRIFTPKPQHLQTFQDWQLRKLNLSVAEQIFFREEAVRDQYGKEYTRHVFTEPWRFQLTVQPNMIDKRRKLDTALEAEIDFIDRYMKTRHLYPYLSRLENGRFKYKEWKPQPKTQYIRFVLKYSTAEWLNKIRTGMI